MTVKRAFRYRFHPTEAWALRQKRINHNATSAMVEGATPSTVTVSQDSAGRRHVSLLVEDASVATLPAAGTAVGVDAGLDHLPTLSTGEKITNPRHGRRDRARLAKARRELAHTTTGDGANRAEARRRVARIHARIAGVMPLNIRTWTCVCGATHDRDVNAAKNLLAAGPAVSACGSGVRPQRRTPGGQSATKQEAPWREP